MDKSSFLLFFPSRSPPRFKIGLAGPGGFDGSAALVDLPGEFRHLQIDLRVRLDQVFKVVKRPGIGCVCLDRRNKKDRGLGKFPLASSPRPSDRAL